MDGASEPVVSVVAKHLPGALPLPNVALNKRLACDLGDSPVSYCISRSVCARTNPILPAAAIFPDPEVLVDRDDRTFRATHSCGNFLKSHVGGAQQVFNSVDFLS